MGFAGGKEIRPKPRSKVQSKVRAVQGAVNKRLSSGGATATTRCQHAAQGAYSLLFQRSAMPKAAPKQPQTRYKQR